MRSVADLIRAGYPLREAVHQANKTSRKKAAVEVAPEAPVADEVAPDAAD